MRILHLTTFLQGGAGRAITDLAIAERRAGHDVRVVASDAAPSGYGNYPAYLDRLTASGIPVRLVDSMFDRRYTSNLAVTQAIDELYGHADTPDVIHTHAAIPSLVALLFRGLRQRPIRIVQTMHGWGTTKSDEQVATDTALLNMVDRVVVPSAASFDTLTSLGVAPSKIAVIPYGVDDDETEADERDRSLIETMNERRLAGALVVATVGTLSARKRQTLVVEAIAQAKTPVFAVFVGDGDDRDLREVVRKEQVVDAVRLHGYSAAARRIASAADVLVLPSVSEGQPLSILEAFADGPIVVTSDIPELRELVDDGVTGFTAASGDATALAAVIDKVAMMTAAERHDVSERAKACYRACFTLDGMVDEYLAAYRASPTRRSMLRSRQSPPAA